MFNKKKHNLKARKQRYEKRDSKEKARQETKKRERIDETNFVISYFDVVPCMKQKQRRNTRKEKTKTRNQTRAKKKDKKEERKQQERDRER